MINMYMLPNNNAEESVFTKLVEHFLRGSLRFSLNPEEIDALTLVVQEHFLNSTIHRQRVQRFPLNDDFCRMFFKKVIMYLEDAHNVHNGMYYYLCSLMKRNLNTSKFGYKHYLLINDVDSLITIGETNNIGIHGTTGMKTWEAAFMLADWAMCNKDILQNKKLLELGSGVGFTGIAIAKHCNIKSMTFTDCHEEVLTNIRNNIMINIQYFERRESTSLDVMMLDWNYADAISDKLVPDILIGADIVFDPSILLPLCKTMQHFCKRNNNLEIYIASIVRNKDTFKMFLNELDKARLKYEEILLLQPMYIGWDQKIKKKILKITYK